MMPVIDPSKLKKSSPQKYLLGNLELIPTADGYHRDQYGTIYDITDDQAYKLLKSGQWALIRGAVPRVPRGIHSTLSVPNI